MEESVDGFLARVELHEIEKNGVKSKPTEKTYETLHSAMLGLRFRRTVSFEKRALELPHATYDKDSVAADETAKSLLGSVEKAVTAVWPSAGIIVVGYDAANYKQSALRPAPKSLTAAEEAALT